MHEGLGIAAFMVSSVADSDAGRLVVKLDNLGVGRRITGGAGPDSALEEAKRRDSEALAVTLAEFAFGAVPGLRAAPVCCGLVGRPAHGGGGPWFMTHKLK